MLPFRSCTCHILPSGRSQAGYSLIEVLVTTSLAATLVGVAGTNLPPMLASHALQNATFQVIEDLRLARQRAIATNGSARIVFGSGSYVVQRENSAGSYVADGGSRQLPNGISVEVDPDEDPTFDSRGLTAQPYTITLSNIYDTTRNITVTAIGRVNVD